MDSCEMNRDHVVRDLLYLKALGKANNSQTIYEIAESALELLKEQEDLGTELTNAMELVRKKNERIKKLEEQIETLTKWRANAGAFD